MTADIVLILVGIAALMLGYPAALTLGGVAVLFALFGAHFGFFDLFLLGAIPSRLFGILTSQILLAIPMFVFMGLVLEKSGVAETMFGGLAKVLRHRRGGLTISVTLVGALLAASTGIVGASVVTLGLLALPTLLRDGESPRAASGAVAAAGTLGQIIPPSIVLIVLGDQMSNAHQKMQSDSGQFGADIVSVTDLFAGALFPGLLLVGLFLIWQIWSANPRAKDVTPTENVSRDYADMLMSLSAPILLILLVLGAILSGIATPTEAASIGAVGALYLAARHVSTGAIRKTATIGLASLIVLFVFAMLFDIRSGVLIVLAGVLAVIIAVSLVICLTQLTREEVLFPVLSESAHLIAMIFLIVIGTSIFALVFRGLGGDETIRSLLADLPGGTMSALLIVMLLIFVLGFFLEFLEITYLVVPLVAPVLLSLPMGDGSLMSPIWLGVLIALNLQTSFLTPPFGVSLFYLRSVAPREVATGTIYRGVAPYVALQLLALAVVIFFPSLATWLPNTLFGG